MSGAFSSFFSYSSATAFTEQQAQASATNNYAGTCDVNCQNNISDVSIDIVNSKVGGVTLSQYCVADANCLFNDSITGVADIVLNATTSAKAQNAAAALFNSANVDVSNATTIQDMRSSVTNAVTQNCNVNTLNQIQDVTILAENSDVSGDISINQTGSGTAGCTLIATMTAEAYASGDATTSALSGGGKKLGAYGSCGCGSFGAIISSLVSIVVIIVLVWAIVKIVMWMTGNKKGPTDASALAAMKLSTPSSGAGGSSYIPYFDF